MASKPYPTRQLGRNGPTVSAIGFGSMGVGAFYGTTDQEETFKTLSCAADRGITFWDCADIYGDAEAVLGKWFARTGRRSEIFLATKFGARVIGSNPPRRSSAPSYIRQAVARSLDQLKVSHIDLYYQHRVDTDVPIEIVMQTLGELVDEGKIKYIGLSECSANTLRRAKAVKGAGDKLIAVQMEFGPMCLDIEHGDFMKAVEETGVAVVAYSPLSRGLASGRFKSRTDIKEGDIRLGFPRFSEENFPKSLAVVDKLTEIGKGIGNVTSSQVALAWILAEYPNFFPIPGCRSVERLQENAASAELQLSPEDVRSIRKLAEEFDGTNGDRYPPQYVTYVTHGNCIPLTEWKGE